MKMESVYKGHYVDLSLSKPSIRRMTKPRQCFLPCYVALLVANLRLFPLVPAFLEQAKKKFKLWNNPKKR